MPTTVWHPPPLGALEELIGRKVVQHVTGTVELWDPAGAWKALGPAQGNDTRDVVAEVCAYSDAHLADLFTRTDVIATPSPWPQRPR